MPHLVNDTSGQVLEVPVGESTIGRGPLLKVTDKRVSRNHACILLKDGRYSLRPIHKNPCFYKADGKKSFSVLPKDVWQQLEHGDCFSLLPDDLIFRVVDLKGSDESKLGKDSDVGVRLSPPLTNTSTEKSDGFLDELFEPSSMETAPTKTSEPKTKHKPSESDQDVSEESVSKTTVKDKDEQTPVVAGVPTEHKTDDKSNDTTPTLSSSVSSVAGSTKKPRSLPTWLSGISTDSVGKVSSAVKRKAPSSTSGSAAGGRKATKRKSAEKDEEISPPPTKRPAKKTSADKPFEGTKPSVSETRKKEDARSPKEEKATPLADLKPKPGGHKKDKGKPLCPYGTKCYRKNPAHFKEYSHDFSSVDSMDANSGDESDDIDSERPLCPYGTDCYRTNPAHRKEYKHSGPAAKKAKVSGTRHSTRKTKGKRSVLAKDSDDDGEPNTYDYTDSFIDDGAGDSSSSYSDSEDSDWAPAVRNDDDEDVEELLTDAKQFIENKKM